MLSERNERAMHLNPVKKRKKKGFFLKKIKNTKRKSKRKKHV